MRRPGEVVSKTELLDHVWDAALETAPNAVEVYVGYLRRKIGRDRLETVRGAGYRLGRRRPARCGRLPADAAACGRRLPAGLGASALAVGAGGSAASLLVARAQLRAAARGRHARRWTPPRRSPS